MSVKVLLDHNITEHLRPLLRHFDTRSAKEMGWASMKNGELVKIAATTGFDVLLTSDKDFQYQQSITTRKIAIIIVNSNKMSILIANIDFIAAAIQRSTVGSFEKLALAGVHRRPNRMGQRE